MGLIPSYSCDNAVVEADFEPAIGATKNAGGFVPSLCWVRNFLAVI